MAHGTLVNVPEIVDHDIVQVTETDLSTKLYHFAKASGGTSAEVTVAGSGDNPNGVLQNAPAASSGKPQGAVVRMGNFTRIKLGGTVSAGQFLKPDTNGKAVAATTDKDIYGAKALEDGVDGDLIAAVVTFGTISA